MEGLGERGRNKRGREKSEGREWEIGSGRKEEREAVGGRRVTGRREGGSGRPGKGGRESS